MRFRLLGVLMCVLLVAPFGEAQVVPGRWEKVDGLPVGSPIVITLTTGRKLDIDFKESLNDLLVVIEDKREIRIPKSDVRSVVRVRNDRLRNGVLIGSGLGFAAGFLSLAAFNAKVTASGPIWEGEALGYYTYAGLVGAGIGLLAGSAIDAARKSVEVLYSR